ncbi:uncharacterized protein LOC128266971 [Anopheles cruzii]|uniref:uncharacterized protein LOC128266971 n=1 Tax=Anopheles cruzii TaxID=68878 RepID=UPI0022EC1B2E|nr:uncharacterized protein LOC128266971 [Anopheles cruzii]
MIDDDEDDYEGYFLRPANEYNIKEKIIQANQESFAIPTPPSPRHPANGERRVTFREQLVDYEPDEYSSEDDGGYGGGGGGTGDQRDGRTGSRRRNLAVIETVADVHRDADGSLRDAEAPDTIIEELHLEDEQEHPVDGDDEGEEEVVEEEQLDYDEDDENGVGAGDRIEKHKTGVEAESLVVSESEEESAGVVEEVEEEQEVEEEEPTDGSSMDTEIHNPESSEEISSSPLKTYRSEADSRSGSGDSQAEDGQTGGGTTEVDGTQDQYEDDAERNDGEAEQEGTTSKADGEGSDDDGGRPLESHRTRRSANCRRKCCRHKKSSGEKLPYYNGFRSEYGLSREELEEKKRRLEARRQRVRERQQRRTAEQRQKAESNEEAFSTWLHGKLRNSINKHQNMYDVRQQSVGAAGSKHQQQQQQQQQQLLHPHRRRRNAVHQVHHTMHQISYG